MTYGYSYYNLSAFFGLFCGFSIACYLWYHSGRQLSTMVTLLTVGAPLIFIGSKAGYVIQRPGPERSFDFGHGYSLYGAFLTVLFFWALIRIFSRYPFLSFLDCVTPGAAIGLAFARLGCFFEGCCGGIPTDLPWAVSFPRGTAVYSDQLMSGVFSAMRVYSLPVHPTQLYEALLGLIVAGLSFTFISPKRRPGLIFISSLLVYSSYRLCFDWLRSDYTALVGDWISINQSISVLLILGSLTFLTIRYWPGLNAVGPSEPMAH